MKKCKAERNAKEREKRNDRKTNDIINYTFLSKKEKRKQGSLKEIRKSQKRKKQA